ncbi:hypothetical protein vseg_010398 [Gypsophila vaccaria]
MHGFSSGSTFFINAEVDSMGGVVENGIDIGIKPSPCRVAIEKAQTELRLEYDVREERRRELEFLEKGGDPLDFKFGHAAPVSVQSTSHTYQHPDQNLASEAKGSFALTASPHGDSVESSGRLGVTIAGEPNSADNFDGEGEILQSDRKSMGPGRSSISPLEHSYQLDRIQNVNNSEDSPNSHPKSSQAYRRRNRSRSNRDGPGSSSDMASCGGHGPSLPVRHGMLSKSVESESQVEMESDGTHIIHSMASKITELPEGKPSLSNLKKEPEDVQNPSLQVDEAPVTVGAVEPAIVVGSDIVDTLCYEYPHSSGADKTKASATSAELNEICKDDKGTTTDALINNAPVKTEGLDSEPPCTLTNSIVDQNGNIDSNFCTSLKSVDSNEAATEGTLSIRDNFFSGDDKMLSEDHASNALATPCCIKEDKSSISHQGNGFAEGQSEVERRSSSMQVEANGLFNVEGQGKHDIVIKSEKEFGQLGVCVPNSESSCHVSPSVNPVPSELNRNGFLEPSPVLDSQPSTENQPKSLDKAQEDMILEEAQTIEAKRKRIAELSIDLLPREHRPKCHWDLVLEEMAWLANDFAQERLWKVTASAQICRRVALASRLRLEEQSEILKQKSVAHTLAKAVMEFWHSATLSVENCGSFEHGKYKHEAESGDHAVNGYAVRFLQLNASVKSLAKVEVLRATNVACDIDLPDVSWLDHFTEESLFYAVPPGAMLTYRNSIESCLVEYERVGTNVQEEVVMSGNDAAADCGYEECDYEEDEGESFYHQPRVLNTGKPSKKKQKIMKSNAARPYEFGGEFGYEHNAETKNGIAQLNVMGKRPANNLHVVIPTKRMRTASRQRVIVPFGGGSAGVTPVPSKADPSSEDTNSFQDDQSTLHGISVIRRGSEVDSKMNFEKQSTFDSEDVSVQPKKKKKTKHQSLSYDQRWQLDSTMQNEQKDLVRKRLDNHQLQSYGNGGLFGQHAKKQKLAKHSLDNPFDNTVPLSGSVASPVASQISNLSSQTKIIKLIGGRGKKGKGLKVSCGPRGSGSPWTIVEDQALVVLVHDMGPNWELVSDAINSILQFKCIFRKPQECKERHKFLMDRPSGDGADSAEDSGSSQPYPSTLPGIPKGSARQLFRSLHAHVEEDNIKSRFEKIIRIQQLHIQKKKIDNQIALAHGSHVLSLSQVIPNNLNGGVLTPLDLCDTAASNQDPFSTGYQTPHAGASPLPNQSSTPPMHLPNGLNSPLEGLQGSSGKGIGNNSASLPSQFISARDVRYVVPRSGSLPIEEQQRLHQHKSMLPGRNVQASNLSPSGSLSGPDRIVRTHPGGNGVSMMSGMNRSTPMVRPGVQGTQASSMLNSGSVLASNVGGTPRNMNVHSGTASGHGNTTFRHRDSLHAVQSGQSSEHQRQMNPTEMQMHATQTYNNQTTTSPLQTYPGHVLNSPHPHLPTSNHGATPEQHAYIHSSRERQMQQRLHHRQHQQHPASSTAASTTHVQAPPQLPMSSPSQRVPLPSTSSPMTRSGPVPHQQQKNAQGLGRTAQCGPNGMINQGAKQRQRQAQQYQQSGRQHPQQRQPQSQQSPKLMKGIENGNIVMHQNLAIDPSHLNGLNSANSTNTLPPSKPLVSPPTSSNTQPRKLSINKAPVTSKPVQQISSQLDSGNQGQALGSNLSSSANVMLSRDQQLMQGQPVLKVKNQSRRSANCDSLKEGKLAAPICVNSSSNVLNMVQEPVSDSAVAIESSPSGFSTSQALTNSVSNEPLSVKHVTVVEKQSSGNNLVSDEFQAQWQQQESHLQSPPLQPLLPQKESHIHGGRSVVFTGSTNSRMD